MKKLLFLALSMLIALPTMAGDKVKSWNFTNNQDGDCTVSIIVPTEKDQAAALKAIKIAINKITLVSRNLITENDSVIAFQLVKNTKMRYNPFAGTFTENMAFNIYATYENNQVFLHFTELTLIKGYSGYGSNVESKSFAAIIDEYNYNQELIDGGNIKKKEKKELLSDQENINGELNLCQEEFDNIVNAIKMGL